LADYREHYLEIRAAAASVVAVSVDAPEASEALRGHLSLPFPILCDTDRCVIRYWDIYNPREKGGIAKPAVFIIDQDRVVRYAAVDRVMKRVAAAQIVCLLQAAAEAPPVWRRVLVPRLSNWLSAIRNSILR
jgi:peroxiredoxin